MPFYKLLSFRYFDAKRRQNAIIQFGVFGVRKTSGGGANHCFVVLLSFHPEINKRRQTKYGTNRPP